MAKVAPCKGANTNFIRSMARVQSNDNIIDPVWSGIAFGERYCIEFLDSKKKT